MSQSKLGSFLESTTNTLLGYVVAIITQMIVFPLYGLDVDLQTNLAIGIWFLLASVARGYMIRRLFNRFRLKIFR